MISSSVPICSTSDSEDWGSHTLCSSQTTKLSENGTDSLRSEGLLGVEKAVQMEDCSTDRRAGRPAVRAIHVSALSWPRAKPCLLR